MKNNSKTRSVSILGIIVMVTVIGLAMTGCASTNMVKDLSANEQSRLYLKNHSDGGAILETVDDTKIKGRWTVKNPTQKLYGTEKGDSVSLQVPAGEHKLAVSIPKSLGFGRNTYEAAFNFEGGKRYLLELRTDPSLSVADALKATLASDYIIHITDMDAPKDVIHIDLSGGL